MPKKRNKIEPRRVTITIDENTHRILSEMTAVGIHGKTVAEVAKWILSVWIWDNRDTNKEAGIRLKP